MSSSPSSAADAPAPFSATPLNPLLEPGFAIRWSQLAPEHVAPGIRAAIAAAQTAIDAIAARDLATLTFENTFLALERSTEALSLAWAKVGHLQSVADTPELRAAYNSVLSEVSAFHARIPLHAALWERLRTFATSPAAGAITGVHRRLLDETVAEFRQNGADLPPAERTRLEAVQAELAQVTQKYSENVLDATNAWQLVIDDEARLAGLPESARAAARASAAAKGLGTPERPVWRFTLHFPSLEPLLLHADDAGLRRTAWEAQTAVGREAPYANVDLVRRILALRAERAALLGRAHFADLVLERRMARSGAKALAFLDDLHTRTLAAFARETAELEAFVAEQRARGAVTTPAFFTAEAAAAEAPAGTPVAPARLAPWDVSYWAEKQRRAQHDFDEEQLRPWFPLEGVVRGLFTLTERVFGVRVTPLAAGAMETWHAEVQCYALYDVASGEHLGSFYTDWHPRESKRGGAWMNYLVTGGPRSGPGGTRAPHLGLMCGNLTPPVAGRPALLKHREVETVFHEFGHLLHHLLGDVPVKSLNGVNVAWDFVELPSQIMENWCWERESLDLFARHEESGAPLPEELFQRMVGARRYRAASAQMRQLAFARMDLLLHTRTAEFLAAPDLEAAVRAAIATCLVPTEPAGPTLLLRFNHLFGDAVGYAAGYYSYKWAEVLDADAFTRFRREGLLSAEVGRAFRTHVLSQGNAVDPAELYRRFMGREPDLAALLARQGLAA